MRNQSVLFFKRYHHRDSRYGRKRVTCSSETLLAAPKVEYLQNEEHHRNQTFPEISKAHQEASRTINSEGLEVSIQPGNSPKAKKFLYKCKDSITDYVSRIICEHILVDFQKRRHKEETMTTKQPSTTGCYRNATISKTDGSNENNNTRLQYRTCCSEFVPNNEYYWKLERTGVLKTAAKNCIRPGGLDIAALYQIFKISVV